MYALFTNNQGWSLVSTRVFKEDAIKDRYKLSAPRGCCKILPVASTVDAMIKLDELNNKRG
ncbi:hypothetical protein [Vibrio phage vB_ValA_R15Z]|uniref:Uncharacterized protein n=1 Tax=Vibrio phage vB_ValA_R15Z TaxID=3044218 RepID=A0AA49X7J1_9CAUD|nr:hypothetical protein [Vibrio phage vB_ValA_R15Z]